MENNELTHKILLTSIITIFFIVFLVLFLYLCTRHLILAGRHRSFQEGENYFVLPEGSCGLDASTIALLPVFAYNPNICLENPLNCVICLSEFQEGEMGRILPKCNHMFHVDCIDMWLYSQTTCPHCRASIELTPVGQNRPNIVTDLYESNFDSSSRLEENRSESNFVYDQSSSFQSTMSRELSFKWLIVQEQRRRVSPSSDDGLSNSTIMIHTEHNEQDETRCVALELTQDECDD